MSYTERFLAGLGLLVLPWLMIACTLEPTEGQLACESPDDCPSQWECFSGYCYSGPEHFPTDSQSTTDGTASQTDTESQSQSATQSETESTSETGSGTGTDTDTGSDSQTGTDTGTGTGTGTDTGTDTGTGTGTGTGTDTDTETDTFFGTDDWTDCRLVRLTNSGLSVLSGFPVPVRLTSSHQIIYDATKSDGSNIRFYASDKETALPYEIEVWSPGANSLIWVRIPTIPASSNSAHFYLCYGSLTASDAQDPPAVWTAYGGVWHLAETSGTVAHDSLGLSDGAYVGSPQLGNLGPMGDLAVTMGNGRAVDLGAYAMGGTTLSIEAIVRVTTCAGRIVSRAEPGATDTDHELYMAVAENNPVKCNFAAWIRTATSAAALPVGSFGLNTWVNLALVFGSGSLTLYIDGIQRNQIALSGALIDSSAAVTALGASLLPDVTAALQGQLAEVRVSHTALSTGWIAAQHSASIANSFVTIE